MIITSFCYYFVYLNIASLLSYGYSKRSFNIRAFLVNPICTVYPIFSRIIIIYNITTVSHVMQRLEVEVKSYFIIKKNIS